MNLSSLLWTFSVFAIIFAPVLNIGVGYLSDTLSLACLVLIFIGRRQLVANWVVIRPLVLILVLLILYALFLVVLFSFDGLYPQVILRPVRALIMFLGMFAFTCLYRNRWGDGFEQRLLRDVFLAVAIHAVIMVLEFVFPDLRDAIYVYTFADQVDAYNQMFRMAGLTNGGGAQLSLYQAFALGLLPLLIHYGAGGTTRRLFYYLLGVVVFASVLLSGRSGVFYFLLAMPAALYFVNKRAFWIRVPLVLALFALFVGSLETLIDFMEETFSSSTFAVYVRTASERTLDLFLGRTLDEHQGFNELLGYFFIPDDWSTVLIGNPVLFDASYALSARIFDSDVGYLNILVGYGLFGLLLHILFYVVILNSAFKSRPMRVCAYVSAIWVVAILIFNLKEIFFFARIGFSYTVLFYAAMVLARARESAGMNQRKAMTGT